MDNSEAGVTGKAWLTVLLGWAMVFSPVVLVALATWYFRLANAPGLHLIPKCIVLESTGFLCPGCGATRAIIALVHGDVAASLQFNPIVLITLVSLPLLGVDGLIGLRSKWFGLAEYAMNTAIVLLLAATFWSVVIRNAIPIATLN